MAKEKQMEEVMKDTKALLDEQKKVTVIIPVDSLNKQDKHVSVCINGYIYQIERGKQVEIPEGVALILTESGHLKGER